MPDRELRVRVIGDAASLLRAFQRSNQSASAFAREMKSTGVAVSSSTARMGTSVERLDSRMRRGSITAEVFGKRMRSIGGHVSSSVRSLAGATIGIYGLERALHETVGMAISFQKQMTLVNTQAGASRREVNKLTGEVLNLAKVMPQGPEELAKGLFHLESIGLRGAKAMHALKVAAEGAAVGNADLEETSTALGAAWLARIRQAGSLDHVMGTLNATVGAGNVRMGELVHALGTGLLPAAKTAGLGLRDVFAAMALFTDEGYQASSAAAQFSTALHFLYNPTIKAQGVLEGIGLTNGKLATDMRKPQGLLVALTDLKSHLEKTTRTSLDGYLAIRQLGLTAETVARSARSPQGILDVLGVFQQKLASTNQATVLNARTALKSLGIDADTLAKKLSTKQGAAQVISEFQDAIRKGAGSMMEQEKILGAILPGGRGRILLTLFNQLTRYQQKLDQIQHGTKHFADAIEQTHKTAAFRLAAAWSTIRVEMIKIGTSMLPTVTGVAEAVGKFVTQMENGKGAGGRFAHTMEDIGHAVGNVFKVLKDHKDLVFDIVKVYAALKAANFLVAAASRTAARAAQFLGAQEVIAAEKSVIAQDSVTAAIKRRIATEEMVRPVAQAPWMAGPGKGGYLPGERYYDPRGHGDKAANQGVGARSRSMERDPLTGLLYQRVPLTPYERRQQAKARRAFDELAPDAKARVRAEQEGARAERIQAIRLTGRDPGPPSTAPYQRRFGIVPPQRVPGARDYGFEYGPNYGRTQLPKRTTAPMQRPGEFYFPGSATPGPGGSIPASAYRAQRAPRTFDQLGRDINTRAYLKPSILVEDTEAQAKRVGTAYGASLGAALKNALRGPGRAPSAGGGGGGIGVGDIVNAGIMSQLLRGGVKDRVEKSVVGVAEKKGIGSILSRVAGGVLGTSLLKRGGIRAGASLLGRAGSALTGLAGGPEGLALTTAIVFGPQIISGLKNLFNSVTKGHSNATDKQLENWRKQLDALAKKRDWTGFDALRKKIRAAADEAHRFGAEDIVKRDKKLLSDTRNTKLPDRLANSDSVRFVRQSLSPLFDPNRARQGARLVARNDERAVQDARGNLQAALQRGSRGDISAAAADLERARKNAERAKNALQDLSHVSLKSIRSDVANAALVIDNRLGHGTKAATELMREQFRKAVDTIQAQMRRGKVTVSDGSRAIAGYLRDNSLRGRNDVDKEFTQVANIIANKVGAGKTSAQQGMKDIADIANGQSGRAARAVDSQMSALAKSIATKVRKGKIDADAGFSLIAKLMKSKSQDGRIQFGGQIDKLIKSIKSQVGPGGTASVLTAQGLEKVRKDLGQNLALYGVSMKMVRANTKALQSAPEDPFVSGLPRGNASGGYIRRASGGWIGGPGMVSGDVVPLSPGVMAAYGEYDAIGPGGRRAIINRHQAPMVEMGLAASGMPSMSSLPVGRQLPMIERAMAPFGGLSRLFNDIRTPHYFARGGEALVSAGRRFAGYARGGIAGMVSAANRFEGAHFPYKWGGGHQGSPAPFGPVDCSGAVSYVLQHGGVKIPTMVSGQLAHAGKPGPGTVTVYANPVHTFMRIGSRYFGTSGTNPGGGAGWMPDPGEAYRSKFAVRHFLPGDGVFASGSRIRAPRIRGGGAVGSAVQGALRLGARGANIALNHAIASMGLGMGDAGDAGPAGAGAAGTGQERAWARAGLIAAGQRATKGNIRLIVGRMQQESAGNPRAINLTDSNAQRGTPTKGLMQLLDSNFSAYRIRSLPNSIYSPVANVAAAVRYMLARYHHLVGSTGKGYARGGYAGGGFRVSPRPHPATGRVPGYVNAHVGRFGRRLGIDLGIIQSPIASQMRYYAPGGYADDLDAGFYGDVSDAGSYSFFGSSGHGRPPHPHMHWVQAHVTKTGTHVHGYWAYDPGYARHGSELHHSSTSGGSAPSHTGGGGGGHEETPAERRAKERKHAAELKARRLKRDQRREKKIFEHPETAKGYERATTELDTEITAAANEHDKLMKLLAQRIKVDKARIHRLRIILDRKGPKALRGDARTQAISDLGDVTGDLSDISKRIRSITPHRDPLAALLHPNFTVGDLRRPGHQRIFDFRHAKKILRRGTPGSVEAGESEFSLALAQAGDNEKRQLIAYGLGIDTLAPRVKRIRKALRGPLSRSKRLALQGELAQDLPELRTRRQAARNLRHGRAADAEKVTRSDRLDAQMAIAELNDNPDDSSTLKDNLAVAQLQQNAAQRAFNRAQKKGDPRAVAEAARNLKSAKDAVVELNDSITQATDKQQEYLDALKEHTDALKANSDAMNAQTATASNISKTTDFQMARWVTDFVSGRVAQGYTARSHTASSGVERSI